jgi:ribosomal protein L29
MRQLDNPLRVKHLRRDVARAKTVLREKKLGALPGEMPGAGQNTE